MASRYMDPVDGDRDGKRTCSVVLRDLGLNRANVEPNENSFRQRKKYTIDGLTCSIDDQKGRMKMDPLNKFIS